MTKINVILYSQPYCGISESTQNVGDITITRHVTSRHTAFRFASKNILAPLTLFCSFDSINILANLWKSALLFYVYTSFCILIQ
jgi:hypothetical protein